MSIYHNFSPEGEPEYDYYSNLTFSANECQIYLEVDCSNFTYNTPPSLIVLDAANKTLEKIAEKDLPTILINNTSSDISASPNVTLENSLLSSIDPNIASQAEITEAFCRDVDSFSWEFAEPKRELTLLEQLAANKWYIVIGVVAFLYIVFMGRNRLKQLWQTRCFTRPKPEGNEGGEGAVTYRGVVAVPAQSSPPSGHPEQGNVITPYPVKPDNNQLPYPPQPGEQHLQQPHQSGQQSLPYPSQSGEHSLPYPSQPCQTTSIPPPTYEMSSQPSSLPYPQDNKQPPYNPHAV